MSRFFFTPLFICLLLACTNVQAQSVTGVAKPFEGHAKAGSINTAIDSLLAALAAMPVSAKSTISYIEINTSLATLYEQAQQYKNALTYYLQAQQTAGLLLGSGHPGLARLSYKIGSVYTNLGQYTQAESLLLGALAIVSADTAYQLDHAACCNYLAELYLKKEALVDARKQGTLALTLIEKHNKQEPLLYAQILLTNAMVFRDAEDYAAAEPIFNKVLTLLRNAVGEEHSFFANACTQMGNFYYDQDDTRNAREWFRQAKGLFERVAGKETLGYIRSCGNLATTYHDEKDFDFALRYLRKAKRQMLPGAICPPAKSRWF
jgi:tetratricopeptide (TPR) repeat protein